MSGGERKKHFAVDKLSSQGHGVVDSMLGDNRTYEDIVKALKERTGETLAASSLQRYHANKWFPLRQALEENDRVYKLIKETLEKSSGKKFDEVTSEIAKAKLFQLVAALKDPDPLALYQVVISEGRLAVEKDKVAVAKQKLAAEEERMKILREQVGSGGDKAALFIEFLKSLTGYLGKKDQEALRHLEPHIRGFAAEIKG